MPQHYNDLTNKVFGELTVREIAYRKNAKIYWKCICSCGKEHIVRAQLLVSGKCTTCGDRRVHKKKKIAEPKLPGHRNIIDITGNVYGKLTVLMFDHTNPRYGSYWTCQCDCGNINIVRSNDLRTGNTKSCGCDKSNSRFYRQAIDITGKRFGKLIAIERNGKNNRNHYIWKCKCECGKYIDATTPQLLEGLKTSCDDCRMISKYGVKIIPNVTKNPIYRRYMAMIARCYNPKHRSYKHYGAKGIYVCKEWYTPDNFYIGFMNFYHWCISNGYRRELSIDRINNDGPYAPWNCRFATVKMQNNNKSTNKYIWVYDVRYTLTGFCEKYNLNKNTILSKAYRGWNLNAIIYEVLNPEVILHRSKDDYYHDQNGFIRLIRNYGNDT